jgi:uncharacterized protein YkwD
MNYVDIVLLLVMAFALWAGWRKGFILGTINLGVWTGSLLAGFVLYKYVGGWLQSMLPGLGVWSLPLAFLLTIIITRIILGLIFNLILRSTPDHVHSHGANRFLGLIPGLINGLIYITIIAAILISVPLSNPLSAKTKDSVLANRLAVNVGWLDDKLAPIFSDAVNKSFSHTTVEPESGESVDLNFTVSNSTPRPDLEAQMLALVNQERTSRGLKPVVADPQLVPVARLHSQDMFRRGYFSHYTPEGKDPFERMKVYGIQYMAAGENLALGQTLRICHEGLMKSPGHRANILNPAYGRLGIGIMDGGAYGLMISQEFRN